MNALVCLNIAGIVRPFAVSLLLTLLAVSVSAESPRPPQTATESQFLRVAQPLIRRASSERLEAYNKHFQGIMHGAWKVQTDEGLEAFADAVLSLRSKTQMIADPKEHRQWVQTMFKQHVLQTAALLQIVREQSQSLQKQIQDVDNRLLVDLETDCDLDDLEISFQAISPSFLDQQVSLLGTAIQKSVYDASKQSLANFAIATASGIAGQQIIREQSGRDGNISLFDELASFIGGLAVDAAVQSIADDITKPRQTLITEVRKLRDGLMIATLKPGGSLCKTTKTTLTDSYCEHELRVIAAVSSQAGVDLKWAWSWR